MSEWRADPGDLVVELAGEQIEGDAGEMTFGRSGDLVIDSNQFMHRLVGRFLRREGVWWLQNVGTRMRLELVDVDAATTMELAPGQQLPVAASNFAVRFSAGASNYELTGVRRGDPMQADNAGEMIGTATVDFGQIPLSPEQHLLLVTLYESKLRTGRIEGSSVLASRLGWTGNKFNRKLDAVCDKLHRIGLEGVKGTQGVSADGRRETVLDWALSNGVIARNDLALLRAVSSQVED